jgi:ABC-2 type transport system permease protein
MSTATVERTSVARTAPAPIPFTRLLGVELTKMFDTRSGFWLMVAIAGTAAIATGAVILVAPDSALNYNSFGSAVGVPIALLLPIVAILSVTSEWSQRNGLTTFTLVPDRARVIRAKLTVSVAAGVVGIAVALGIGALGTLLGSAVHGVDPVWDISATQMACLFLANVLNMLVGFMLGVLIRSSPGAIVGYVVYSFIVPTLSMALGAFQDWWVHAREWLDFNWAQGALYEGDLTRTDWAQLGVAGTIWLVLPLAIGLAMVMRSEVK